ncbi:MAG: cyclase family protein [Actinobacteria bacterium]|nr:cyclase family protein [Actinomycetota bacterium]
MSERERIDFAGKTFEVYDLSQVLSNDTSAFEPNPHSIAYTTHAESAAKEPFGVPAGTWPDGEAWSIESVTLTTHSGTHVDAPYHYSSRTSAGAPARTIEGLPFSWVMGDAFLLEMMDVDPAAGITAADVRRELGRIGYEPKQNDIALIRTDISERFGEPGYETLHPGMRRDATAFLVEHGVRLIGIDAWGLDRPMRFMVADIEAGDPDQLWESHKYGAEHEYAQIEKLRDLASLPRPHGFQVLALPVAVEGAGAGWARVVALVEVIAD